MTVKKIKELLSAQVICGEESLGRDVHTCLLYTSDAADEL